MTRHPFKVYTATNLKGSAPGKTYNGYLIVMRPHPVDVFGDGAKYKGFPFKATLYTNKSIVVEAPVVDYSDAGNDDDAFRDFLVIDDAEILAEKNAATRADLQK